MAIRHVLCVIVCRIFGSSISRYFSLHDSKEFICMDIKSLMSYVICDRLNFFFYFKGHYIYVFPVIHVFFEYI